MGKHHYAYGHTLSFHTPPTLKQSDTIYINEIKNLEKDHLYFQANFHTNQKRKIYLLTENDFRNSTSLEKWIFVVEDVVSFVCDTKQQQIFYHKDFNYTDKLMEYWLIHILLPIYLTLNDSYYFFHTGSVEVNNQAVLFIGDSYAGKSTLTDFFLKKGHTLLSDDKLGTYIKDDDVYCTPSHPYHRPYRNLEDLGIKVDKFEKKQVEVGKIFWLKPVDGDADVSMKKLKGLKKFEVLRYSTEMDLYVNQEERFKYISKIANSLDVYEIEIPHDKKRLDEVYNQILTYL